MVVVGLYEDINFGGNAVGIDVGEIPDFRTTPIGNDIVSSFSMTPGYELTLYEDINYQGASVVANTNWADLRAVPFDSGFVNFNDLASSCKVRWVGTGLPLYVQFIPAGAAPAEPEFGDFGIQDYSRT